MFGIEISGVNIYGSVSTAVMTVGLWKLFEKCGQKGWWALIPGGRYLKLGECAGREKDGRICMVLELGVLLGEILSGILDIASRATERIALLLALGSLVFLIIQWIQEIKVYNGLCSTFAMGKRWIFAWILAPFIPACLWGFGERYKPVNLGRTADEDHLAGTKPAELKAGSAGAHGGEIPAESLVIRLKERTVNDFFKKRYLLKDISLTIPNGSMTMLLGGSGSGKTTFVNAITGYEKADAVMLLNGRDIYKEYEQMKYRIGFVPQQPLLRMNDTVNRTLEDAAALRLPTSVRPAEMKERVRNVMDTLGLTAGQHGLVSKKSGGMKKRISIGMELISDPDLFILDEPDSGLDGVIARELFTRLREVADQGKIVITITHTPDRVIDLFDYVIVLARDSGRVGRLAFFGSPAEARNFFGKNTMEEIVMAINRREEGGEGRADEFVEKYAALRDDTETAEKDGSAVKEAAEDEC